MTTNINDELVYFKPISLALQLSSLSGGAFNGYSIGGAASAGRTLTPQETSVQAVALVLCTLIKDLMGSKLGSNQ
jgi:hypothetical protein